MENYTKIELEFIFQGASSKVLYSRLSTPSGLAEWFADDVNVQDDKFTFIWEGTPHIAVVIQKKVNKYIRYKWESMPKDTFFEFRLVKDDLTKDIALHITDYVESNETDSAALLWESQVNELKNLLGS